MPTIDPQLYEYCTPRQREVLDVIKRLGDLKAAALELGMHRDSPALMLRRLRQKASNRGYAPAHDMTHTVPEGFKVKGVSTLYNKHGDVSVQWVKSSEDAERREEMLRATVDALSREIKPVAPTAAPDTSLARLLTLYTFTDYHLGMLAWHKEGGDDWDLNIASDLGIRAMQALVAGAPKSERAVINIQGDFMHFDGHAPVTPTHGHILDADSRFGKLVDAAIDMIRHLVSIALQHHQQIELLICEGNHDLASSLWLRKMFKQLYRDEPRVRVTDSELPYYVIQHGKTMLAFHHGHLKKNEQLPMLFAAMYPKVWGDTEKRYCHTGHRHHVEESERPGMKIIQHPTLSARDAYAARGGWISEREATAITYDTKYGKVGTNTITPEMCYE